MTADPRDTISDFTEMTDRELSAIFGSFFRAIGWGAVAGGGFFMVFTVPFGLTLLIADGEPRGLIVALLPLGIAFAGTLIGMIGIGLPLTMLLRYLGRELLRIYSITGIVGGLLLPLLIIASLEGAFSSSGVSLGIFLGPFGAMAGGVCGHIWGSYREDIARAAEGPENTPTNPYHDMIY